jgi:hypothetical protein
MLLVSKVHDLQKRKSEDEEKVRKGERKTHLRLPPFPHHLLVLLDRDQAPPSNPVAIPRPLRLLRQAQLLVHPPSNVRANAVARDENVGFDSFAILELDGDTGRSVGVIGEAFAEDGDAGREELDKLVEKVGAGKGEKVSPSRYIPRRRGSPMHVDISGSLVVALDAASRSGSDEKVKGSGKERRRTSRRRLRAFCESFQRCGSRTCNIGLAQKRRKGGGNDIPGLPSRIPLLCRLFQRLSRSHQVQSPRRVRSQRHSRSDLPKLARLLIDRD